MNGLAELSIITISRGARAGGASVGGGGGDLVFDNLLTHTSHIVGGDGNGAAGILLAQDYAPLAGTNLHADHPRRAEGANEGSCYHYTSDYNSTDPTDENFTCGEEGTINANGPGNEELVTPPGAIVDLGTPPTGSQSQWAATTDTITFGSNSRNNSWRHYPRATTKSYTRMFLKYLTGFQFGDAKIMTWNKLSSDGGIDWACLKINNSMALEDIDPDEAIVSIQVTQWPGDPGHALGQNQGNNIVLVANKWYYIEVLVDLVGGVFSLWINEGTASAFPTGAAVLRAHHTSVDWGYTGDPGDEGGLGTNWWEEWSNTIVSSSGTRYMMHPDVRDDVQWGCELEYAA